MQLVGKVWVFIAERRSERRMGGSIEQQPIATAQAKIYRLNSMQNREYFNLDFLKFSFYLGRRSGCG